MSGATSSGKIDLQAAASDVQQAASAAPASIQPAFKKIADAFSQYADALAKAGYTPGSTPTASQIAAMESAVKTFETSDLISASQQVEAWAEKNCKA